MDPVRLATIGSFAGGGPASGDRIMEALAAAHDAAVQMIDTSVVRVHQHGACIAGNRGQHMGRSRGGLTSNKVARRCRGQRTARALGRHSRRGS